MNSDLFFGGKKYISSSRAAKISGYVNDYIGQLCRDGKLESQMVGRSWYVSLDSLINHKNTYGPGARSKGSKKVSNVTYLSPLSYSIELPATESIEPAPSSQNFANTTPSSPAQPVAHTSALTTPAFVEVAVPPTPKASLWKVEKGNAVLEYGRTSISKLGFGGLNILKIAGVFAVIAVLITGFRIGMIVNPDAATWYTAEFTHTESLLQANVFSALEQFWNGAALAFYTEVRGLFDHTTSVLVSNEPSGISGSRTSDQVTSSPEPSRQGLVVVPTNANTDRAGVIAKIKNSFSDDVVVKPGDSESGVITPVFKNTTSNDYLYVLVPVNGKH